MKRFLRVVCFTLCACLAGLSLVGCSGLDDVAKSVVGTWESTANGGKIVVTWYFNEDGTVTDSSGGKMTFKHAGDGTNEVIGHYEIIKGSDKGNYTWALPDNNKDVMYAFVDGELRTSRVSMTRIK